MTLDIFTPAELFVIDGSGPYAIASPYGSEGELIVTVVDDDTRIELPSTLFSLDPVAPATSGSLYLDGDVAEAYAGKTLSIVRDTAHEQGWIGGTSRERGLAGQLDRMVMGIQDNRTFIKSAMRTVPEFGPLAPVTTPPAARADRLIAWNEAGRGLREGPALSLIEDFMSQAYQLADLGAFNTVAAMLAYEKDFGPEGSIVRADIWQYRVAAADATEFDLLGANGAKLVLLPLMGWYFPRALGGQGDGIADDSEPIRMAVTKMIRDQWQPIYGTNAINTRGVMFDGGEWRVTQPDCLMPELPGIVRALGLTYAGAAAGTSIFFDCDEEDAFLCRNNNQYLVVKFENLRFGADSEEVRFIYSFGAGGAQDVLFFNCGVFGVWRGFAYLEGHNNNSEWRWNECDLSVSIRDTFLEIPIEDPNADPIVYSSDQFLNYWFHHCKLWLYDGQLIRAYRGGHFKITQSDCSGMSGRRDKTRSTKGSYWIELGQETHARGVCTLVVDVRSESKVNLNADAGNVRMVYCEWGHGTVDIRIDMAPVYQTIYDDERSFVFHRGRSQGPLVRIHDSFLMGKIYTYSGQGTEIYSNVLMVENTTFMGYIKRNPASFVEVDYNDEAEGDFTARMWPICFQNCRPHNYDILDVSEENNDVIQYIWDVTFGGLYTNRANVPRYARFFGFFNGGGNPVTDAKNYMVLPPNTWIMSIKMRCAGYGAVSPGATWRVEKVVDGVELGSDPANIIFESAPGRTFNTVWSEPDLDVPVRVEDGMIVLYDASESGITGSSRSFFCEVEFLSGKTPIAGAA